MSKHRYVLLPTLILLAIYSGKLKTQEIQPKVEIFFNSFKLAKKNNTFQIKGDFSNNQEVNQFIDRMVKIHGFKKEKLCDILSKAKRLDYVLRLMDSQASNKPNITWLCYRNQFITKNNVNNGVAFWNQYEDALNRAWKIYGVPPEIIVGIIGVETRWGQVMGKTRILDALATLSFYYPRRSAYFLSELEAFLVMTRKEKEDPLYLQGSFAGAMGYGQFMPSSYRQYAVDFNGDGRINLWDPIDSIGSVANYFKSHGWIQGGPVVIRATGSIASLEDLFQTNHNVSQLEKIDITPTKCLGNHQQASLLRLNIGAGYQYWLGLPNFYTITRYNKSTYYAMTVWQLGQEVALARSSTLSSFRR